MKHQYSLITTSTWCLTVYLAHMPVNVAISPLMHHFKQTIWPVLAFNLNCLCIKSSWHRIFLPCSCKFDLFHNFAVTFMAGCHHVPRDMMLSQYFAHDNDNITIQRFCDNRYIARNFIHDTSRYLCHWRNSEFIGCTESISQELQNIVSQFHEWQPSKTKCILHSGSTDPDRD